MITQKTADMEAPLTAEIDAERAGAIDAAAPATPPAPEGDARSRIRLSPGLIAAAVIALALWISLGPGLMHAWNSDKALSHGPLVPIITGALLWLRRDELKNWDTAKPLGLLGVLGFTALFVLAVWADVEFMKSISLLMLILSGIYFLGGARNLGAAIGPLAFLVFMIPWPNSLTERIAFPLQLASTTYSAIICGLFGLPIERDGVHIAVMNHATPPEAIFKVVVAQQCSGLTSLTVLLALGYLISYFTPIKLGWRALLMAVIVPLTLLCNAIRLSVILLIGANYNKDLAMWAHDNEGPVLIFFCSVALMGARTWLLKWVESRENAEAAPQEPATAAVGGA